MYQQVDILTNIHRKFKSCFKCRIIIQSVKFILGPNMQQNFDLREHITEYVCNRIFVLSQRKNELNRRTFHHMMNF